MRPAIKAAKIRIQMTRSENCVNSFFHSGTAAASERTLNPAWFRLRSTSSVDNPSVSSTVSNFRMSGVGTMCQIGSLRRKDSATFRTIVFLHEPQFDRTLAKPQIRLETIARKNLTSSLSSIDSHEKSRRKTRAMSNVRCRVLSQTGRAELPCGANKYGILRCRSPRCAAPTAIPVNFAIHELVPHLPRESGY